MHCALSALRCFVHCCALCTECNGPVQHSLCTECCVSSVHSVLSACTVCAMGGKEVGRVASAWWPGVGQTPTGGR